MPTRLPFALCSLCLLLTHASSALAQPRVVTTIPPLHSLTALVMEGAGYPQLLLKGSESPHRYSLRPSQTRLIASAEIIVRVGASFEIFMNKPLRALAGDAVVIDLDKIPGIQHFSVRDHHEHHYHKHHGHGLARDPHIWLHTGNAAEMVKVIAGILSGKDPENSTLYAGNAARTSIRLRSLKMEIDRMVQPVRTQPFVTFHDAWQYFTAEFGLKFVGALTLNPERKPGARRLAQVRETVRKTGARCLFSEPQFPSSLARVVVRGTPAKIGVLDPVGAKLSPGSGLYFRLMRQTALEMTTCLGSSGG